MSPTFWAAAAQPAAGHLSDETSNLCRPGEVLNNERSSRARMLSQAHARGRRVAVDSQTRDLPLTPKRRRDQKRGSKRTFACNVPGPDEHSSTTTTITIPTAATTTITTTTTTAVITTTTDHRTPSPPTAHATTLPPLATLLHHWQPPDTGPSAPSIVPSARYGFMGGYAS